MNDKKKKLETETTDGDVVILQDEIVGELSDDDPTERAVFFALDEAAEKLNEEGGFDPFLIILEGDQMHIEEQTGDDEDAVIANAKRTVFQMERLMDAYVFTYDGYVDLEEGQGDAIIVEWARKGDNQAQVLAWLYERHDDHIHFRDPLYNLGTSPSFCSVTAFADEIADADTDAETYAASEAATEAASEAATEAASEATADE